MAPLDPPTSAPGAPDATPATRHVVVIGGGLAGLVAARQVLRERPGTRVTILEATDRIGGKLRLERVAGHLVDVGAEAMLARRPEAVDLVRELGAEDELVSPATTAASIWSRGRMHPVPRATLMGVPADVTGLGGLLTDEERARLEDEQPWPEGPLTTDVSVGDYVGTRLGRAVVDRLVEPLLGGVYAGRADEMSLAATMPAVWEAATRGDSLRAVAAAAAAARWGGGAPFSAGASPATTADPRSGPPSERPVFAGIRGGIGRLPELLRDDLGDGVDLRTTTIARGLRRRGDGFAVLVGPTTDEEWIDADAVVLATPPAAAGRLLSALAPGAADALAQIPTASSAVISLAFRRDDLPELVGSGFLTPTVEGRLLKGGTFSGNKWAWTGALDPELVFVRVSVGRAGEEATLQRSDADLVAAAVAELGEALSSELTAPVDSHVQRWGGGLPQYVVGHLERMDRLRTAIDEVPGLEVAGAAYGGVGIPAVIATATSAATRATAYLDSSAPTHARSTS